MILSHGQTHEGGEFIELRSRLASKLELFTRSVLLLVVVVVAVVVVGILVLVGVVGMVVVFHIPTSIPHTSSRSAKGYF